MNLLTRAGYFFMLPLAFPFTHQNWPIRLPLATTNRQTTDRLDGQASSPNATPKDQGLERAKLLNCQLKSVISRSFEGDGR